MELEELKKKLYKPETEFEERLEKPAALEAEQKKEKAVSEEWAKIEEKKISPQKKKRLLLIIIPSVVIFLAIVGWFFWRGLTSFDKDKVSLEIEGPERVVSGEEIKYSVKYKNNTRLDLTSLQLVFYYPEDSILTDKEDLIETIELADLLIGQEEEIELPVRLIGLKGEEKEARAELTYQPAGLSSQYTNQADFSTTIISVPLVLDFDLPQRLVGGQSFDFSLRYLNQAEVSFDDLRIEIDYPEGFVFQSADPSALEDDSIWSLGKLMAGEQGRIFIRGSIQGEEGEAKSFKARLGFLEEEKFVPIAETIAALQISLSPLSVSQTVNGQTDYIAQAGQTLTYQIDYKNTTDIGIKNVVIASELQGKALDLTSLNEDSGSFDGQTQTITWKVSNLPALEFLGPYQEGQISFSINIKNPLPIESYSDKNFTVINTVKIDAPEVPLALRDIEIAGQSQMVTKIASQLTLQAQGYFQDDLIPNSGPIPPKVGQTTTYTIKWRLVNSANDLSGVKVEASLPPHVQWQNRISPANAGLTYNSQTGRLVWQVGDLPAATGVLLPVKQVAFQIAITPGLAHLGGFVELIGQSKATDQDDFVGLQLTSTDEAIDTDLPDDPTISGSDGVVVE